MSEEHISIVNSPEYKEIENENTKLRGKIFVFRLLLPLLIVILLGVAYRYQQAKSLVSYLDEEIAKYNQLSLDVKVSYYDGYSAGKKAAYDDYYSSLETKQRVSYSRGYATAMIDMQSRNDYAYAYSSGEEDGWSLGYDEGYSSGYDDGFEVANDPGYDGGYEDGYEDGYSDGYYDGLNE